MSASDGQRDGNASDFESIIYPGVVTSVYRGRRAEEWEVGRNRIQEFTREKL